MRKTAGSVPRPNESGPLKQVVLPGRFGPVDQKRWRMPSEEPFESVLAEAVAPPRLRGYTVTALMSVCLDGGWG